MKKYIVLIAILCVLLYGCSEPETQTFSVVKYEIGNDGIDASYVVGSSWVHTVFNYGMVQLHDESDRIVITTGENGEEVCLYLNREKYEKKMKKFIRQLPYK